MINYDKQLKEFISTINKKEKSLLLHSCCAPCSSYVLEYLSDIFNITIFYYNPNITPKEEYEKRLSQQKMLAEKFCVPVIEVPYDSNEFFDRIKGCENCPERGERCYICYKLRLEKTASLAENFDYFTTTLSISPHKNAQWINEIGISLGEKYLPADFKKSNGYKRSIELSKEYGLYRQDYCGCVFSKAKTN
ncbi:MAG: epoxyqueuosine reductase QueH [Oscillospiraceae bacterium]